MMNLLLITLTMTTTVSTLHKAWLFDGTTPKIKEIMLGRCYSYMELSRANHHPSLNVDVNCEKLWEAFSEGWVGVHPCGVGRESYKKFFTMIDTKKTTKDQLLFWSGMHRLSGDLAHVNDNFFTLEKSFPGYLVDSLQWCGCVDDGKTKECRDGGIYYGDCKKYLAGKECSSAKPYWDEASRRFALSAEGTVHVMVNGTTKGTNRAYRNESTFKRKELPTLGRHGLVKRLVILVVFDLGVPPREKCGESTVGVMINDALKYGIKHVDCIDNPRMVKSLLCAKFPHVKQCRGDETFRRFLSVQRQRIKNGIGIDLWDLIPQDE